MEKAMKRKEYVNIVAAKVVNEVTEKVLGKIQEKSTAPLEECMAELKKKVSELTFDVGVVAGEFKPQFIRGKTMWCTAGIHAVVTEGKAVCGWKYPVKEVFHVPAVAWWAEGAQRCKDCTAAFS